MAWISCMVFAGLSFLIWQMKIILPITWKLRKNGLPQMLQGVMLRSLVLTHGDLQLGLSCAEWYFRAMQLGQWVVCSRGRCSLSHTVGHRVLDSGQSSRMRRKAWVWWVLRWKRRQDKLFQEPRQEELDPSFHGNGAPRFFWGPLTNPSSSGSGYDAFSYVRIVGFAFYYVLQFLLLSKANTMHAG